MDCSTTGDSERLVSLSLPSESVRDGEGAELSAARELLESVRGGSEEKLSCLSPWFRDSDLLVTVPGFLATSGERLLRPLAGLVPTKEEVADMEMFPEDCQRQKRKME